jgi:hypothetical protein
MDSSVGADSCRQAFTEIGFQKSQTSRKIAIQPMPSESGTSVRLQIGHVLFMDLVAYSTQLLDEQRQYQEQLTEIVRGTEQVRSAKGAGKLIQLPVLVFLIVQKRLCGARSRSARS